MSESNPTEPSSSQSSEGGDRVDEVSFEIPVSSQEVGKFEPRSVVVPLQKYNLSFNSYKKSLKHKSGSNPLMQSRSQDVEEIDLEFVGRENVEVDLAQVRHQNMSELVLPPNMDVAEVMTAHMRYPAQVHRVEAMRPLPRGRTISRGPPMIFGEPAPFNQKSMEASAEPPNGITKFEKSYSNPALHSKSNKSVANQKLSSHEDVITERQCANETDANFIQKDDDSTGMASNIAKQNSPRVNSQQLFVPRFVALPPQRGENSVREEKGNFTDRTCNDQQDIDENPPPFTVR